MKASEIWDENQRASKDKEQVPDVRKTMPDMDELIHEHLHRFTENNLFRASILHFVESGKASGTWRAALRAMMGDYAKPLQEENKRLLEQLEKANDIKNRIVNNGDPLI